MRHGRRDKYQFVSLYIRTVRRSLCILFRHLICSKCRKHPIDIFQRIHIFPLAVCSIILDQSGLVTSSLTKQIDNLQEQLDDSKKENNSTKQKENKNDTKKKDNQQSDDAGTDEPPVEDNTSNGNTSDQEGTNDTNNETTEMQ